MKIKIKKKIKERMKKAGNRNLHFQDLMPLPKREKKKIY